MVKYEVVQSENRIARKYDLLLVEIASHIEIMNQNGQNSRTKIKLKQRLEQLRKQIENPPKQEKYEKIKYEYEQGQKQGKKLTELKEKLSLKYKVSISQVKKIVYGNES